MKNCENCLHVKVCEREAYDSGGALDYTYAGECDLFKDRSRFAEVVHGRWVQKEFWPGGGTWRCSKCGYQVMFMEDTPATKAMHYCPNCGAKMDKDG